MISVTLSVGYLTIPLFIKYSIKSLETTSAEEEDEVLSSAPQWSFGNTICISSFVTSPPVIYPTIEKHVLQLAENHAHTVEKETLSILSTTLLNTCHGLVLLSKDLLGILSSTAQHTIFTLQIVQFDSSAVLNQQKISSSIRQKSYQSTQHVVSDVEQSIKPFEIIDLCQAWPNSQAQLRVMAKQAYQTASLYGYWDYWRVFEGICERYNINSQQLL